VTARLDARGLRCPWPVLRAAALLRTADALEVLADDPAAPGELAAMAAGRGWAFLAIADGEYRIDRTCVTDC